MVNAADLTLATTTWVSALPSSVISSDTSGGAAGTANIFGYAGMVYTIEAGAGGSTGSGLPSGGSLGGYLARHRWYASDLGRWFERDPAGYVDGMNLYLYAGDNPVLMVDPMGLNGWFSDWFGGGDSIMGGFVKGLGHGATMIGNAATGGLITPIDDYVQGLKTDYGTPYYVADYSATGGAFIIETIGGVGLIRGATAAQQSVSVVVSGRAAAGASTLSPATSIVAVGESAAGLGLIAMQANNVGDKINEAVELANTRKLQDHHFATNKNTKYTPRMREIADRYGLDLDGDWNRMDLPQLGRHADEYHEWVLQQMRRAADEAGDSVAEFIRRYQEYVIREVCSRPEMLYKEFWRSFSPK